MPAFQATIEPYGLTYLGALSVWMTNANYGNPEPGNFNVEIQE